MTSQSGQSEFKEMRRELDALRARHGADSPIGHRCSNLLEQLENLPPGPEDRIEFLTPDSAIDQRAELLKGIEKSKAELLRLLAEKS